MMYVELMTNGFVDSYLVVGPDGILLSGMDRVASEAFAKQEAKRLGVPYVDSTRSSRARPASS